MKLVLAFSLLFISVSNADSIWRIEVQTGSAHSFDTTLTIDQDQGEDYSFAADYETRPFQSAPYSAWRLSRWKKNRGWELEFLHHKIYLKNTPPGIETFRISNGYNMLLLNHAWERNGFVIHVGGGAVIAFPIANIANVVTDGGYRLAGIAGQGSLSKRFRIRNNFFLIAEGKFTAAYAAVSLKGSEATAPNIAVHGLAGFGFDL